MYNIIIDTREKMPIDFSLHINCKACIREKLETGDYTIEGFENKLIIERKHSVTEIAMNMGVDKVRFEKELERMKGALRAYIICEFSVDDILKFPKGANIPFTLKQKVRINGKFVLKMLSEYEKKYGVQVVYCGNEMAAYEKIVEVMDEFYEIFG